MRLSPWILLLTIGAAQADVPICFNPNTQKARFATRCNAKEHRQTLVTAGSDEPAPAGRLPMWGVREVVKVPAGTVWQTVIRGPSCAPGELWHHSAWILTPAVEGKHARCESRPMQDEQDRVRLICTGPQGGYDDSGNEKYLPVPEDKQVEVTLVCLGR